MDKPLFVMTPGYGEQLLQKRDYSQAVRFGKQFETSGGAAQVTYSSASNWRPIAKPLATCRMRASDAVAALRVTGRPPGSDALRSGRHFFLVGLGNLRQGEGGESHADRDGQCCHAARPGNTDLLFHLYSCY